MKKSIITLLICFASILSFAQDKKEAAKDTTLQLIMNINQYRSLLMAIDQNIDSKKVSSEILIFLQKSAQIVYLADKPKTDKPK